MKTSNKSFLLTGTLVLTLAITACQKNGAEVSEESSFVTSEATIAVATSATSGTSENDSVYVVNACNNGEERDSVSEAALPATATSYMSANYAGYVFGKAYSISASGTIKGYVAIVYYNSNPVALKFDAAGNFVKVLEQRERGDLRGKGWHHGGRFQHRNGQHRDTVALTSLSVNVLTYFASTFSTDTLVKAYLTHHNWLVVITKNDGLYATSFDASGAFKARVALPHKPGRIATVEAAALPAAITTYLQSTYPAYVFNKAFNTSVAGTVQGYVVLIDANNTRYALAFDASGTFVAAKVIR